MKILFAVMTVIILSTSASQARTAEPKPSALQTEHDIYEAALRWRLQENRLSSNARCHVFIANGHIAGFGARLKEYRVIVHAGAPDSKRPSDRWYWLRLGEVRPERAGVMLEDHKHGVRALHLKKKGGRWQVVVDEPFILT